MTADPTTLPCLLQFSKYPPLRFAPGPDKLDSTLPIKTMKQIHFSSTVAVGVPFWPRNANYKLSVSSCSMASKAVSEFTPKTEHLHAVHSGAYMRPKQESKQIKILGRGMNSTINNTNLLLLLIMWNIIYYMSGPVLNTLYHLIPTKKQMRWIIIFFHL